MKTSGLAETTLDIVDLSVTVNTGLKGVIGVLGHTERGPINTPILIGSWPEFVRNFGGLSADDDFPLYCRRILDAGGRIKVSRVGHYTTITDKTTLVGTKATVSLASGTVATFTAKSIGLWANTNLTVKSVAAANGVANQFDVTFELVGYPDLTETIKNVPVTPTATQLSTYNNILKLADITSVTTLGAFASTVFSSGAQVYSAIITADYIGDSVSGTGIRSFDQSTDIVKIAVPAKAINAIDVALANYADLRKDLRAIVRTPVGLDGATGQAYRDATGSYSSGSSIDTWRATMVYGDLNILHPVTGAALQISAIGDVLGAMSRKDNVSKEWFAAAGYPNGVIKNNLGVVFNVGTAANKATADSMDIHGLSCVIAHESFGTIFWGNNTLQKADTLLKHANVADLMIYLTRTLKPLAEISTFKPNDIITWKSIYRKIFPVMDRIVADRGIWKYLYQGDQDITDISQAAVNTPDNIDNGAYVFNLWVAPIVGLKYIAVRVAVTNSGANFDLLAETFNPEI